MPELNSTGTSTRAIAAADELLVINEGGGSPDTIARIHRGGGSATLDFGFAPGSSIASVTVTGQSGIELTSRIKVWLGVSTADHNEYEHTRIFPSRIGLAAGDIVTGTGFTIHAETELRLTGDVAVYWEWM